MDPIGLAGGLNLYGFANGDPINFSDPFGLCPPEDNNKDDCQTSDDGKQRDAYCPRGTTGTPPNCVAADGAAAGVCPSVSGREWDIGQRAIALSTATPGLEYGFAITGSGVIDGRTVGTISEPGTSTTPARLTWPTGYPAGTHTVVHSHPSGNGISGADLRVGTATGTRQISAGVGTNVYGAANAGGPATNCNTPMRPR